MKTIKNHAFLLGSLLAVIVLGSAGCDYATTKPHVLQAHAEEQKPQDENIVPQATPAQDETSKELQDLKGQYDDLTSQLNGMTQENESLRAELEKEKQDLEKTIADLQAELKKAKAAPEPLQPADPQIDFPVRSNPPTASKPQMFMPPARDILPESPSLGEPSLNLPPVGGMDGDERQAACGTNQAITTITAATRDEPFNPLLDLAIGCNDVSKLSAGKWDSSDATIDFGEGSSPQAPVKMSLPDLDLKFAFTGYAVYPCVDYTRQVVICGFRAFAKPVTSNGINNEVLWLSPVVGLSTGAGTFLNDDDQIRSAAATSNDAGTWIGAGNYEGNYSAGIFVVSCPEGSVLTGFQGHAGARVNGLAGVCRSIVTQ